MRGCDVSGLGIWLRGESGSDHQSAVVDRHRYQVSADGSESRVCAMITGILDPNGIARIKQHAQGQVDRLLRSGNDDDLLWLATNRTSRTQVLSDLGSE